MISRSILSAVPFFLAYGGSAWAEDSEAMFAKASSSLSPLPFGTLPASTKVDMKVVGDAPCESWSDCEYVDVRGVGHSFEEARLVIKFIAIDEATDSALSALGIGRARAKADVLRAANEFLGDAALECIGTAEDECFVVLGDSSIKLTFDRADELSSIRLDDWTAE
jgi:hypothetical protein